MNDLEKRIQAARRAYVARPSHLRWEILKQLVRQRTPEQVEKMEREKGLK